MQEEKWAQNELFAADKSRDSGEHFPTAFDVNTETKDVYLPCMMDHSNVVSNEGIEILAIRLL